MGMVRLETQRISLKVNVYYKPGVLREIRQRLLEVGGEDLVKIFKFGPFGHLLRWSEGQGSGRALHQLISREIRVSAATEHETWFRIDDTNICFSPAEYCLISGLKFGSTDFDPQGNHEASDKTPIYAGFCPRRRVNVHELKKLFLSHDNGIVDARGELHLQMANILAAWYMGFGNDDRRFVPDRVWVLLSDISVWNRFVPDMDNMHTGCNDMDMGKKYHFYCNAPVF